MSQTYSSKTFPIIVFLLALGVKILTIAAGDVYYGSNKMCVDGWRYHNRTGKCYELSSRGPCGEGAHWGFLTHNIDSWDGQCICDPAVCNLGRPRVLWEDRCYFIFDQGPCPNGEWVIPVSDFEARCAKNPCPQEYAAQERPAEAWNGKKYDQFLFPHAGKCYKTLEVGFPGCGPKEKVFFDAMWFSYIPLCSSEPFRFLSCILRDAYGSSQASMCLDGTQPNQYGGCNPLDN